MDPATARVALKVQLEDVDAILKTLPPTSQDAKVAGEIAAFRTLRNELVRKWHEVNGQAFAYNILREENNNRVAFNRLMNGEQQAERDHDMACRLAGVPLPQRAPASNKRAAEGEVGSDSKADVINGPFSPNKKPRVNLTSSHSATARPQAPLPARRLAGVQVNSFPVEKVASSCDLASKQARVEDAPEDDEDERSAQVETYTSRKRVASEDSAALRENVDGRTKRVKVDTATAEQNTKRAAQEERKVTCSSCFDQYRKTQVLELPCKDEGRHEHHAYCRECLQRLFESSVTDPSHFPPRCCSKIISLSSCRPFLSQGLIARFVSKQEELITVNRTYCSNADCSKWVRPMNILADVATCTECKQKTCAVCKGKQHAGLCPEDKDAKELMKVARQKRWQTCPHCKEMVELERGCYHITCRCRHEFCYQCVAKWKSCDCPLWDEHNIIDRPPFAAANVPAARAPAVNRAPAAAARPRQQPQQAPFRQAVPAFVQQPAQPLFGQGLPAFGQPLPQAHPALAHNAFGAHAPAPNPFANFDQTFGQNFAQTFAGLEGTFRNFGQNFAGFGQPAAASAAPPPPPFQQPQQVQNVRRNHRNNRRQQQVQQPVHQHDFERYYRSEGWNTECGICGNRDRWVNCCSDCDLKVCWRCTKYRT